MSNIRCKNEGAIPLSDLAKPYTALGGGRFPNERKDQIPPGVPSGQPQRRPPGSDFATAKWQSGKGDRFAGTSLRRSGATAKRQRRPFQSDFATAKRKSPKKTFFAAAPLGGKKALSRVYRKRFWGPSGTNKNRPRKVVLFTGLLFRGERAKLTVRRGKGPAAGGKPPPPTTGRARGQPRRPDLLRNGDNGDQLSSPKQRQPLT